MKRAYLALALVLVFMITVSAQVPAETVPSFTFKKLNKSAFTNKDLEPGKLLFFVFFDTECDHCQRAIQYIDEHYNEFKKTAIYLITLDSLERITGFMSKYGNKLKNKKYVTVLQDLQNEFIRKFRPGKYPSLFLYSAKKELIIYEDNEKRLAGILHEINKNSR